MRWKNLAAIFLTFLHANAGAQLFPYNFQTWNSSNGLSSDFCNKITQDKNGYLYVTTNAGIFSFNSSSFSPLNYVQRQSLHTEGTVEDIVTDNQNRLWFSSLEFGVGMLDLNERGNLHIRYFYPDSIKSNPANPPDTKISKLVFDSSGSLWVGTRGNGLYRLDTAKKKFTNFPLPNPYSLYHQYIRCLYLHNADSLFVGMVNGLCILNPQTGKISYIKISKDKGTTIFKPTIRKIVPWAGDTILAGTDKGIYLLQLSTGYVFNLNRDTTRIDFSRITCNDILRLSADEWWFATSNKGVLFYRPADQSFEFSSRLQVYNKGIPKCAINAFYKDKNDNIWLAYEYGIALFKTSSALFRSYNSKDSSHSLAGSLQADKDKLVCMRSDNLQIFDIKTNTIGQFPVQTISRKDIIPSCTFIDSSRGYVMFFNDSFFAVHKNNLQTTSLPVNKTQLSPGFFRHFRVLQCIADTLHHKEKWILLAGGPKGSLIINYDPATGDMAMMPTPWLTDTNYISSFTRMAKEANGVYWIATKSDGIYSIDINDKPLWHHYHENAAMPYRIPGNYVADMIISSDRKLWAMLYGKGLWTMPLAKGDTAKPRLFGSESGMLAPFADYMIEDLNKNIWLTGTGCLYYFETKTRQFYKFLSANGIGNVNFHLEEIDLVKTTDGYIALSNKFRVLTWFSANSLKLTAENTSLTLNGLKVNNQYVNLADTLEKLIFSSAQNDISFLYDVIDYEKIVYYQVLYKLEGFDKDWQVAQAGNQQSYRQLPGNQYLFRIKLKFADGSYSPEKNVSFYIQTIWYKTWWFRLFVFLTLAAITLYVIHAYVQQKLLKQKAIFERQKAIAIERSRISAELHDDLGSGLSTIRILSETNRNGYNWSDSNSNMLKISGHSQDLLQKMGEIVWALNTKNDTLPSLLSYIRAQTARTLEDVQLEYTFFIPDDIPEIKVTGENRRHIYLVVKEILHNSIKHAEASRIQVAVAITGDLTITIRDDGKGLPGNQAPKRQGNGIDNMLMHVKALQGSIDMQNEDGLSVRVTIPIRNLSHESVT